MEELVRKIKKLNDLYYSVREADTLQSYKEARQEVEVFFSEENRDIQPYQNGEENGFWLHNHIHNFERDLTYELGLAYYDTCTQSPRST